MSRLVLDTNVVVSAFLTPHGNEAAALRLALSSRHQVAVTQPILDEYRRVLSRPKLTLDPRDIVGLFTALKQGSILLQPAYRLHVSPHDADNRFLECAEASAATFLITGNKKHFPAAWKGTKTVNAREFLELMVPL